MSDYSAQFKEIEIEKYINSIDFNGDFSIAKIKSELRSFLNETPAVEVKYKKEVLLTEDLRGNKVTTTNEKVKSVVIAFTSGFDVNNNPILKKVEIYK
jgi:hypothetical protein